MSAELKLLGYFPNESPSGKGVYYTFQGLSVMADVDGDGEITIARSLRYPAVGAEVDTVDKAPAVTKAGEMVLKIFDMLGITAVILQPESSEEQPEGSNSTEEGV